MCLCDYFLCFVFVCLFSPSYRYFSQCMFQHTGMELGDNLKKCTVAALKKYKEVNGVMPDRIIVYRDGVGDGQVSTERKGYTDLIVGIIWNILLSFYYSCQLLWIMRWLRLLVGLDLTTSEEIREGL